MVGVIRTVVLEVYGNRLLHTADAAIATHFGHVLPLYYNQVMLSLCKLNQVMFSLYT